MRICGHYTEVEKSLKPRMIFAAPYNESEESNLAKTTSRQEPERPQKLARWKRGSQQQAQAEKPKGRTYTLQAMCASGVATPEPVFKGLRAPKNPRG